MGRLLEEGIATALAAARQSGSSRRKYQTDHWG